MHATHKWPNLSAFLIHAQRKNALHFSEVYEAIPDTFTKSQLTHQLQAMGISSPVKQVIYDWAKVGVIDKAGSNYIKVKNNLI